MVKIHNEHWRRLSPYLDVALDLAAGERPAWLAELRRQDVVLAAQLKALLEMHDALNEEGFLEHGPALPSACRSRAT